MLVGINTLPGEYRPYGGHEDRYLRQALAAMSPDQDDTQFVVYTHELNHEAYTGWNRVLVDADHPGFGAVLGGNPALENAIKQTKPDLVFSPLDNAANIHLPQVLYALDVAVWERDFSPRDRKVPNARPIKKACAQARAIVVPSEYLRRRCLDLFDAPLNKIVTALPGVSKTFEGQHEGVIEKPYIAVYLDALTAANVPLALEAFEQLEKEQPFTFVVAGWYPPGEPADWGGRVVRIESLPDNHLAGLYQNSELFIYPAIHDGSALRVIEAMRAGVPIVAANTGAINEQAADAPVYFNAASLSSLLQGVRRMLAMDKAQRNMRIHIGQNNSKKFDWEKTAWRILSAFSRV